jgi:hypothetical protein
MWGRGWGGLIDGGTRLGRAWNGGVAELSFFLCGDDLMGVYGE